MIKSEEFLIIIKRYSGPPGTGEKDNFLSFYQIETTIFNIKINNFPNFFSTMCTPSEFHLRIVFSIIMIKKIIFRPFRVFQFVNLIL